MYIIYYSTFLSLALSEKALDTTTDTQEENLISGGVPRRFKLRINLG